ncbi:MAG: response regulator [Verrucomicrobiales bacterium]|nr:response regulator [Verrucomicrobiales bacterium]
MKRVLIIDDDVALTQVLKINLDDTGNYESRIVNVSSNAIAAAREFKPDIILLDVVMPGLDGGDISAALKQDPLLSKVPVLIITALVSNDETGENAVVSSGDQVMIAKPIRLDVLTKAIEDRMSGVL